MKNTSIMKDGWHETKGGISYYVENGLIIRGLSSDEQRTLYPYHWSKALRCYTSVTPRASYSALRRIYWK